MASERILTIGLNTLPRLRAAAATATFERFGTAAAILAAPAEALTAVRGSAGAGRAVRSLDAARAGEAEELRARERGVSILTLPDPPTRRGCAPSPTRRASSTCAARLLRATTTGSRLSAHARPRPMAAPSPGGWRATWPQPDSPSSPPCPGRRWLRAPRRSGGRRANARRARRRPRPALPA